MIVALYVIRFWGGRVIILDSEKQRLDSNL